MPNGALSTNIMVNVTANGIRRVEWTFGIAYGDNVDEARNIILSVLAANEKVLKDPATYVAVKELNSSSVDFCAHGWVKCADYWGVLHGVNEDVYKEFNKKGINIQGASESGVFYAIQTLRKSIEGEKGDTIRSICRDNGFKIA